MALVTRRSSTAERPAREAAVATRRSRTPEPDEDEDDAPAPARVTRRRAVEKPAFQAPDDEGLADEDGEPVAKKKSSFKGKRSRDEDEDEAPTRAPSDAVQSGWGAANKMKKEGGSFADEFTITKEPQLVVFLEDAPYAVYKQHWVEGLRSTGKKSFICMGKGCPLCKVGESAAKKWAFNVAVIEDDEVELKSLIAGSRLFDNIADEHEGSDGPLNEGVWTLSKSGVKQSTTYKLKSIEGRKLESAFGITEDDVDALLDAADLPPYTASQHQPPALKYLQEIADELIGADD